MRLKVRHATTYRYATPAGSAIQQLRLFPRPHDSQFVRRWRVEVDADCRLERGEDAYGNVQHTYSIEGPITELSVLVDGDVETINTDGLITGTPERFPQVFWLRETKLTEPGPAISELARDLSAGEGGDRLATLHALNKHLYQSMKFTVGTTDTGTSAAQAFAAGAGVCQDFAHIFLAATRLIGIPARYIGGYYLRTDREEQDAGHAWVEAHVAGVGWIGFDPVHGVCVTDRYIRVAAAPDYLEAAPIRGARVGGFGETLDVSVTVSQGPAIIEA